MTTCFGTPGRSVALLLASCVLSACALSGRSPQPPTATFLLEGTPTETAVTTAATGLVLTVSMPIAAPAFASPRMAYVEQPYRIDYFSRNEWADAPTRMLRTVLTQQLTDSGLFRYVIAEAAGVDENVRLDTYLDELVQVFSESASEVHLSIRFDLIDVAHRSILLSETISVTEPASARNPYAGVVAANRALQRVLDELVAKLREPISALDRSRASPDP
jgi:cholesterol transport system auxiliary component